MARRRQTRSNRARPSLWSWTGVLRPDRAKPLRKRPRSQAGWRARRSSPRG